MASSREQGSEPRFVVIHLGSFIGWSPLDLAERVPLLNESRLDVAKTKALDKYG